MILLWGRPAEAPLAGVQAALLRRGARVALFDEARACGASLSLAADSADGGALWLDGCRIDLAQVRGAYFRPYGAPPPQSVAPAARAAAARRSEQISAALWGWADIARATVLNRPALMASNASKPLQARLLAACGFDVPQTLVTSDAAAARAFAASQGAVIYKSVSATRSIVARLDAAAAARLDALSCCPVQFQQYVPGVDVRVHVVGEALFACEIRSPADDYRYAARQGLSTGLAACTLPDEVAARCRRAAAMLGLPLCGIDLRRTPDGRWLAFEANPSPGYSYFADATGAPIADAIATLLLGG